jgi:hypothetical protein
MGFIGGAPAPQPNLSGEATPIGVQGETVHHLVSFGLRARFSG